MQVSWWLVARVRQRRPSVSWPTTLTGRSRWTWQRRSRADTCCPYSTTDNTPPVIVNNWSKKFDERPHRRGGAPALQIVPFPGWSWPPWFLAPTRVLTANGISIGSAVLAQLTVSDVSRRRLRSNSNDLRKLLVPRIHNKLGDRSFSAAGPRLWNDLPPGLRRLGLTFDSFRQSLKTHLFGDRGAYWLSWMYRRYINKFIYLSLSMRCGLIITVSLHHSPKTGSVERWRTMSESESESAVRVLRL